MEKLLTVVVPVYKVEEYINKCLDSLILPEEQMDLLEVIIVNDGTPDRSAEMAREYEKRFPKTFRVIDKENGGHGSACNRGLKEAKGKFLRFLDSDDWVHTGNLSILMNKLLKCDADIIFSDVNRYYSESDINVLISYPKLPKGKIIQTDSFDWNILGITEGSVGFHQCTYKSSMLQPLYPLFLEKQCYDDGILWIAPIVYSNTLIYFPGVIYNYLLGRDGQSVSKGMVLKRYRDMENLIKSQILMAKRCNNLSVSKQKRIYTIISTMIMKHCERLSLLPYKQSKYELEKWYHYLIKEWPNYKESKKMRIYKYVPYSLYWLLCKYV